MFGSVFGCDIKSLTISVSSFSTATYNAVLWKYSKKISLNIML